MYFGDEDPALISDTRKTLISNLPLSPEEQQLHQEPAQQTGELKDNHSDQVLMFNEESGSFEYSSGGADLDVSDRSGNEICAVSLPVPLVHHCIRPKFLPSGLTAFWGSTIMIDLVTMCAD